MKIIRWIVRRFQNPLLKFWIKKDLGTDSRNSTSRSMNKMEKSWRLSVSCVLCRGESRSGACDVHEGAADNLGHFVILGIHP